MATTNIAGLFATPDQRLEEIQAAEQARALGFAGLNPLQQANYGVFMGGQQLGRGLAGVFGVQDPQLQRIRQRQEIMQTINPADPDSLRSGIQRASQAGDQELALSLADYMRKAEGDIALAQQRTATKSGQGIQEAARINEIETLLADLDPDSTEFKALTAEKQRLQRAVRAASGDKFSQLQELYAQRKIALDAGNKQDVQILDRLINSIAAEKGGDKAFESIVRAERIGVLTDELEELEAANKKDTPEYRRKASVLKSLQGDKGEKVFETTYIIDQIFDLEKQIRDAKNPAAPEAADLKAKADLLRAQLKTNASDAQIVGEVEEGEYKGYGLYYDKNKDQQFVFVKGEGGQIVRKPVVAKVDRVTSKVTATASTSNIGEKTVVKGVAELDVEDLKTVRANKRAASASNESLRSLLALDDKGLIGGAFATGRVGVGNLLNTLGVLSKKDSTELSNSQEYQKIGADLIFNALQGKLGTGVSNADRDFIKEIFPQLETSAAARRRLIKYLADKNNKQIDEANAAEDFLRKNKSFEGYKPLNSGVFHVPTTRLDLTGMTNAELKAAIDKKKSGGK